MYHILNGDSLKHQLENILTGDVIIARECLVDGPVTGETLEELYKTRAAFLNDNYGSISKEEYQQKVVAEFEKIQSIPKASEVNLWFEDDLFCQVNMWFILSLLRGSVSNCELYLIRPAVHTRYGFGGLSQEQLDVAFQNRIALSRLDDLGLFWNLYQEENLVEMQRLAKELYDLYPFLLDATEAHLARIPTKDSQGRPADLVIEIMKELNSSDFGEIFNAFSQRAPIYGYGDLQVRRLMEGLI